MLKKSILSLPLLFLVFLTSFPSTSFAQKDTLNLLTWNIYMRPRAVFWNYQKKRAEGIVNALKKDSIDVIIFQEAFDRKARRVIGKGLSPVFPFEAGPGKKGFFKLNSGVWILSKYPITNTNIASYEECAGGDCMAIKSAVLAELTVKDKKIHVIGTHLQASQGDEYTAIRESQLKIMKKLAETYYLPTISQVFTGDMNTPTRDSTAYQAMLNILSVTDEKPNGSILHSSRSVENDINKKPVGQPKLIDFILLKKNSTSVKIISREVMRYQFLMKNGKKDLSDHYAVKGVLIF